MPLVQLCECVHLSLLVVLLSLDEPSGTLPLGARAGGKSNRLSMNPSV
jgi:hypothetical protein